MRLSEIIATTIFIMFAFGLVIAIALALTSCAGAPPKLCPLKLEAQYTAELVEACADAGSIAACKSTPAFAEVQARHRAEQRAEGCRK